MSSVKESVYLFPFWGKLLMSLWTCSFRGTGLDSTALQMMTDMLESQKELPYSCIHLLPYLC